MFTSPSGQQFRCAHVDAVEEMMCVVRVGVTEGAYIVVNNVIWRRLCVSMILGRLIYLS